MLDFGRRDRCSGSAQNQIEALLATYEGPTKKAPKLAKVAKSSKSAKKAIDDPSEPRLKIVPETSPFYGMAFPEATAKQIELAGEPQLPREIWPVLDAAGFVTNSKEPLNAVFWALKRRAEKRGDVILVGEGRWGLTRWYTPAEIKHIVETRGKMAGRDREMHIRKTKIGVENLRANGVKIGAPAKMTAEKVAEARELLLNGMSVAAVAEKLGVSKPSVYFFFRIKRVNGVVSISPRNPPPTTNVQDKEPKLRVVK